MTRFALSLLALSLLTITASADYRYDSVSGYYVNNGLYYAVRQVWYPASPGYCAGYYPAYVQVPYTPPATNNVTVNFNADDNAWEAKLIDLLKYRERQASFRAALQLAGYSGGPAYAGGQYGYGSLAYGTATSTTGFAYQNASIALQQFDQVYSQTDIGKLLQGAQQLVDNMNAAGSEATKQINDVAAAEAARNTELLQLRERRLALTAFLQNLNQPKSTTVTQAVQTGPAPLPPQTPPGVLALSPAQVHAGWTKISERCVNCHAGAGTAIKAFDLSKLGTMDIVGRARVIAYITPSADAAKRCPKGGQPLTAEEFGLAKRELLGY